MPPQLFENPFRYLRHLVFPYTSSEKTGLERTEWFRTKGIGYAFEQSTQPQTLAYSLADSPSGLLAWIYEKLVNWTDGYPWSHDEGALVRTIFFSHQLNNLYMCKSRTPVLTWVSLYWFSRDGPGASIRIYYETKSETNTELHPKRLKSPFSVLIGHSVFPKDIFVLPKSWLESYANIVFYNVHSSGGHFAAYEKPVELSEDLQAMFGKKGPAFQAVEGSSGYSAL